MRRDERGEQAAEAYAQWYLGDPSWADMILRAYENPDETFAHLEREKGAFTRLVREEGPR